MTADRLRWANCYRIIRVIRSSGIGLLLSIHTSPWDVQVLPSFPAPNARCIDIDNCLHEGSENYWQRNPQYELARVHHRSMRYDFRLSLVLRVSDTLTSRVVSSPVPSTVNVLFTATATRMSTAKLNGGLVPTSAELETPAELWVKSITLHASCDDCHLSDDSDIYRFS